MVTMSMYWRSVTGISVAALVPVTIDATSQWCQVFVQQGRIVNAQTPTESPPFFQTLLSFHWNDPGSVDTFCRLDVLRGQLELVGKHFGGVKLTLCYEASYVCLPLQGDLQASHSSKSEARQRQATGDG